MLRKRIAIDLGTANTIVATAQGIIIEEPTVVAISPKEKKILAVGMDAKLMLGKSPSDIIARRPLKNGVIASFKLTEALLNYFIKKAVGTSRIFKPDVMISVPAGVTSVEERAVIEAATNAGAGKVYLIPEPIAAAIGAKLPINSSSGNMIVNMGGGTSEIAVISLNGIVAFKSERIAGDEINEKIINFTRRKYGLLIGEQMAEKIKKTIVSATTLQEPLIMEVRGRDANQGAPIAMKLNSNDLVEAVKPPLSQIIAGIKEVLERTPPELATDIIDRGMVLSGGTALIKNVDELFTKAIGVPAHVVDDPIHAVIKGIIEAIDNIEVIRRSLRGY